ncbi:unnamed protein product, partial [Ceratitis capitata]
MVLAKQQPKRQPEIRAKNLASRYNDSERPFPQFVKYTTPHSTTYYRSFETLVNPIRKLTTIATKLVKKLKLPYSHSIYSLTIGSLSDKHLHVKCNGLVTNELPTRPSYCGEIMKRFGWTVFLADPKLITTDKVMLELGTKTSDPACSNSDNGNILQGADIYAHNPSQHCPQSEYFCRSNSTWHKNL